MAIENTEKELDKIYKEIDGNKLVLPNFQRGFVWDRNKQKQLLASILVDLPVGSLLILEGSASDFSKRKLCFPDELTIESDCDYVLDGQQRLSTLRTMFYDIFSEDDWKTIWDRLFGPLRTRWFLRVKPNDGEEDYLGYNTLQFKRLNRLTDTDIVDFLEYKVVHKTKINEVHHPAYKPKNDDGSDETRSVFIQKKIVDSYSEEFLIPLYEIYKGDSGIHNKVLNKIVDNRVDTLKLEAEDGGHKKEYYKKIFGFGNNTPDDIAELYDEAATNGTFNESIFIDKWAELKAVWIKDFRDELNKLAKRKMAIIYLHRDEVNRAVAIFEAINRGGEPLSVYDLVVAKSARDQSVKNLSSRIIETLSKNIEIKEILSERYFNDISVDGKALWCPEAMGVTTGNEPSKLFKELFVNTLSLLVNVKEKKEECKVEHIKKEKILSLTSKEVNDYCERAITAVIRALAFLQFRCGIVSAKNTPYKLMTVVLSFYLDDEDIWNSKTKLNKLEYWYWTVLFGGAYFFRQNERCRDDIINLEPLISKGENKFLKENSKILNVEDFVTKDILLRKDDNIEPEQGTVKKAILAFILSQCPKDFIKKDNEYLTLSPWNISNETIPVELHHVTPLGNATKLGESTSKLRKDPKHLLNSTMNLSYISKDANRQIRDKSPNDYLKLIEELGIIGNFIPPIRKFTNAFKTNEYREVLEERFEMIDRAIKKHISDLL